MRMRGKGLFAEESEKKGEGMINRSRRLLAFDRRW